MTTCLTHLEEYVKEMYLKIGITKPSQLDFHKVKDLLGIRVFYWPEASQALFMGHQGFIFLNEHLTPQQQWQDFCHELAHVLLHTGNQGLLSPLFIEYQENKANSFMYHACVPTFMLDELRLYAPTSTNIWRVQKLFDVEPAFARKRLEQYISNKQNMANWNCKSLSPHIQ